MNPWNYFKYIRCKPACQSSHDKIYLSLHFSLIPSSAAVVLGTFTHRLVMSAQVRVLSVQVPAGQHRAITAFWLSMWFLHQPQKDCPIEIPLQLPSSRSPLSTSLLLLSVKVFLMQQSDIKGRGCRWDVACGCLADQSDLCRRLAH